ncbi:MAG TPA: hypothetical protein PLF26_12110 [Blastocatellia bacterium]|nr:hypothetical protein [Blastocatellia bacterium]
MRLRSVKIWVVLSAAIIGVMLLAVDGADSGQGRSSPDIPRTWDDEAMRGLELPLADATATPRQVSADFYYRMPVRPIYRTYPIYHPDREPRGYMASLERREPEIAFDSSRLKTDEDWVRAGAIVFAAPIEYEYGESLNAVVRTREWYRRNKIRLAADGTVPYLRYVVREKGKVEIGILACAMCHTRVMPNGTVITGAQGNFPDDRSDAYETRVQPSTKSDPAAVLDHTRKFMRSSYAAPWLRPDPNARFEQMALDDILKVQEAIIPGVCARQGSSPWYPVRIPDLIGVKDRRYLDASGLVRHRTIGDLMRYAALNQGADLIAAYGDFVPEGPVPDPATLDRYSDEELYALALYVYSLKPPPNPNVFGPLAARGQKVFEREGCAMCHTPPLYTNNMLTPAAGFEVSDELAAQVDVMPLSVGTDPDLTLRSRRGTGFYKVPSLKGVWYRGPFGHMGQAATLEEWFDPRRVRDDYVPKGFRRIDATRGGIKGHEFGLDLSMADRRALIAFLRTL